MNVLIKIVNHHLSVSSLGYQNLLPSDDELKITIHEDLLKPNENLSHYEKDE